MDALPDLPLFEIIINLSAIDLKALCQSNKRLNGFLDEYFWHMKIVSKTLIKYKYYPTWFSIY